jgi:hypothetical protein
VRISGVRFEPEVGAGWLEQKVGAGETVKWRECRVWLHLFLLSFIVLY